MNNSTDVIRTMMDADKAQTETFLAEHPEIKASKPHWARSIELPFEPDGGVTAGFYELQHGVVSLMQDFSYRDGAVTLVGGPKITIDVELHDATVEKMRQWAGHLLIAADRLENATIR